MELTAKESENGVRATAMHLGWGIVMASEIEGQRLPVSPQLIDRFNKAAVLSQQKKHLEALAAWDVLLSPAPKGSKLVATTEFVAECYMRRAYVLMDLKRYTDAKAVFESSALRSTLSTVPDRTLGNYYFSYGNTLKALKDHRKSVEMLALAEKYKR